VIDARRDQVYGAVYAADGMQVSPEVVSSIEPWLRSLPTEVDEFVTAMPLPVAHIVAAPEALAGVIARIACDRLLRGQACDPAALDANYVRRSDAELFWRDPK
jgi:tRNA threonylcarbamoyladenosine biosynthesis protein TsaB